MEQLKLSDFSSLATIIAGVYTILTYHIFKQTSQALKLNAYINLKKELSVELIRVCSHYGRLNKTVIDDTLDSKPGYFVIKDELHIKKHILVAEVIGILEDVALYTIKRPLNYPKRCLVENAFSI